MHPVDVLGDLVPSAISLLVDFYRTTSIQFVVFRSDLYPATTGGRDKSSLIQAESDCLKDVEHDHTILNSKAEESSNPQGAPEALTCNTQ